MALVAVLGLEPARRPAGVTSVTRWTQASGIYTGDANFGFNFTCEVETAKKRTVIKGQITYHDGASQELLDG